LREPQREKIISYKFTEGGKKNSQTGKRYSANMDYVVVEKEKPSQRKRNLACAKEGESSPRSKEESRGVNPSGGPSHSTKEGLFLFG